MRLTQGHNKCTTEALTDTARYRTVYKGSTFKFQTLQSWVQHRRGHDRHMRPGTSKFRAISVSCKPALTGLHTVALAPSYAPFNCTPTNSYFRRTSALNIIGVPRWVDEWMADKCIGREQHTEARHLAEATRARGRTVSKLMNFAWHR